MNYSDLTTALGNLLQYVITDPASAAPSDNTDFNTILPNIINDAEQRIYREMDFLATNVTDSTATCTIGDRVLSVPSQIIVVEGVCLISPQATQPAFGKRNKLQLVSKDFIDVIWPDENDASNSLDLPQYAALYNNTDLVLAPTPNAEYVAEITGIFRPAPISPTNTSTYLSQNFPDLFLAACMVFATGWQRDFGAQSDNPQMSQSWETLYQTRKKSVMEEEQRRQWQSTNWSPLSPAPLSTPQRP